MINPTRGRERPHQRGHSTCWDNEKISGSQDSTKTTRMIGSCSDSMSVDQHPGQFIMQLTVGKSTNPSWIGRRKYTGSRQRLLKHVKAMSSFQSESILINLWGNLEIHKYLQIQTLEIPAIPWYTTSIYMIYPQIIHGWHCPFQRAWGTPMTTGKLPGLPPKNSQKKTTTSVLPSRGPRPEVRCIQKWLCHWSTCSRAWTPRRPGRHGHMSGVSPHMDIMDKCHGWWRFIDFIARTRHRTKSD